MPLFQSSSPTNGLGTPSLSWTPTVPALLTPASSAPEHLTTPPTPTPSCLSYAWSLKHPSDGPEALENTFSSSASSVWGFCRKSAAGIEAEVAHCSRRECAPPPPSVLS